MKNAKIKWKEKLINEEFLEENMRKEELQELQHRGNKTGLSRPENCPKQLLIVERLKVKQEEEEEENDMLTELIMYNR